MQTTSDNTSTPPDGRKPSDTLRRAFTSSTSPLALAASQYRADMEAAIPLSETMEGCGDFVAAAEHAFHERAEDALPFRTVRDALAAIEWVRGDLAEGQSSSEEHWPADVAHRHLLLTGAADLLREVQEAGAVVFSAQGLETTRIPDLGMTFREAADRAAALIAESDADDRDDNIPEVDAEMNARCDEYNRLHDAVLLSPAVTVGDFLVKVGRLVCPVLGLGVFVGAGAFDDLETTAGAIREDLEKIHGGSMAAALSEPAHSEMSDAFRRFMDLRESFNHLPNNREPNQGELAEEDRLFSIITDRPADNATDALAQLALFILVNMGDSIVDLESGESGYARALHHGLAYFASVGDPSMGKLFADAPTSERNGRAFWAGAKSTECVEGESADLGDDADEEAAGIDPQDDAELLDLWIQYLPLKAEAERLFDNGNEDGWEHAHAPCNTLEDRIAAIPARTPAGIAVKLGVLWQWGGANVYGQTEHSNERRDGANHMSDFMVRWLWMIMNEARALGVLMPLIPGDPSADVRMAAALSRGLVLEGEDDHPIIGDTPPLQPVNGNDATADGFADTVAAFQEEASATLAIPQQPTGGMVEAGASAAGITPEQFAAAYAAAVEALKLERAA